MRRMNYPRFDKPTYVGTYDPDQSYFILDETKGFFPDHEPAPGIYFVIIKDIQNSYQYSLIFTITMEANTGASWYSMLSDETGNIFYIPGDGPMIAAAPTNIVRPGATIELYKLD